MSSVKGLPKYLTRGLDSPSHTSPIGWILTQPRKNARSNSSQPRPLNSKSTTRSSIWRHSFSKHKKNNLNSFKNKKTKKIKLIKTKSPILSIWKICCKSGCRSLLKRSIVWRGRMWVSWISIRRLFRRVISSWGRRMTLRILKWSGMWGPLILIKTWWSAHFYPTARGSPTTSSNKNPNNQTNNLPNNRLLPSKKKPIST